MEKIYESEYRFLCILWEHEPIESPELVRLCESRLGWKKSTTYTVIKKLSNKGIVQSENTVVRALVTKEEAERQAGDELLEKMYFGNVPAFLAAFLKDRKLSKKDIADIRKIIEDAGEDD